METPSPTTVQRERESAWKSYSACHFVEQAVKAFSKCLGLDPTTEKTEYSLDTPAGAEVTSTTSRAFRRPPRPPLSVGRGAQINRSSF
ncbi:Elicitor peptide [Sesbania bispinosa]|nr:Elicitor peptide [Sesbania bispinosa]